MPHPCSSVGRAADSYSASPRFDPEWGYEPEPGCGIRLVVGRATGLVREHTARRPQGGAAACKAVVFGHAGFDSLTRNETGTAWLTGWKEPTDDTIRDRSGTDRAASAVRSRPTCGDPFGRTPEALRPSNLECCVRVQRLLPGLVLSDETQVNWDWAYEEDDDAAAQDVLLIN